MARQPRSQPSDQPAPPEDQTSPEANEAATEARREEVVEQSAEAQRQIDESLDFGPKDATKEAVAGTDPSTVEFVTVETTGPFMLIDPFSGKQIEAEGSTSDVPKTSFIVNALEDGRLKEV